MTLQEQYIQNLRDIITDMVGNIAENPRNPWIQPSSDPLMDGYNRPYSWFKLLAVTHFKQKNHISTPFFCHAYQRRLFHQPVKKDEPGIPMMKKDGTMTSVYPCRIKSVRLDEKMARLNQNRKELQAKAMMRMHLEKFSPINEEGIVRHIYRNIVRSIPELTDTERLIAEMAATLIALEMGLPKFIEPDNIRFLDNWMAVINDEDNDINEFLQEINAKARLEMGIIGKTEIKEQIFKDDLDNSIKKLQVKDHIPRHKSLEEALTPSIKIK